jgi:hypothetical protein
VGGMQMNHSNEYLPRTVLYSLNPLGMGTPFVESLSGYISRLAYSHCLTTGTLMSKLLAPSLNKTYLTKISQRGGNGFYDSSSGINGIGTLANDFVEVIQSLNHNPNLESLTLIRWNKILPTRGLMRDHKAWCAKCYHEAKLNNSPAYDQLIWYLKEVSCCPKHKISLSFQCPNCSRKMQVFSRNTRPGYCQYCNNWLGEVIAQNKAIIKDDNLKIATYIGDMVVYSSSDNYKEINRDIISLILNKLIFLSFEGSVNKFSKHLAIPETTLRYWLRGVNIPPLHNLITICLKLNISMLEFLGINDLPSNINIPENSKNNTASFRPKYDYQMIKMILASEINIENPNSLKKLAETIGCDRKLLYQMFPKESETIVKNYSLYLTNKKVERQKRIKCEVEKAINFLEEKGEYPSRRKLELVLKQQFLVKEKIIRDQWNNYKENCL